MRHTEPFKDDPGGVVLDENGNIYTQRSCFCGGRAWLNYEEGYLAENLILAPCVRYRIECSGPERHQTAWLPTKIEAIQTWNAMVALVRLLQEPKLGDPFPRFNFSPA